MEQTSYDTRLHEPNEPRRVLEPGRMYSGMELFGASTTRCDICGRWQRHRPTMFAVEAREELAAHGWTMDGKRDICPLCSGGQVTTPQVQIYRRFIQYGWLPRGLDSSQLLNLRQMVEFGAEEYVNVGAALQSIQDNLGVDEEIEEPIPDSLYSTVKSAYRDIQFNVSETQLNIAACANAVEGLLAEYENARPTYRRIGDDIRMLRRFLKIFLEERRFFFIPPERAPYYSVNMLAFDTTLGKAMKPFAVAIQSFPSAEEDVREAGNCFALGRYTATVFHLMRVVEVGLTAISNAKGIPSARNPNWGTCLAEIEKAARNDPSLKEPALFLRGVKDLWRNPTMHVERTYSEEEARSILNAVEAFMVHLATRFSEQ
jgi:HEPN domain-containing protein